MGGYEIRIIKADGSPSLVYACSQISDFGAIRSVDAIQREVDDRVEVWRGMICIYCEDGLYIPQPQQARHRSVDDRAKDDRAEGPTSPAN